MNRLSNYLTSAKLAKLCLIQAEEDVRGQQPKRAVLQLMKAMRYMLGAQNNLASIAFHKRPRR